MLSQLQSHSHGWLAYQLLQALATRQRPPFRDLDSASIEWLRSRRIDSLAYNHLEPVPETQFIYQAILDAQIQALREVVKALETADIEVITFKGAEFLARYFSSTAINVMADVDILIRRRHIDKARQVLGELAYRQAAILNGGLQTFENASILDAERDHYELVAFRRLDEFKLSPDASDFNSDAQRCLVRAGDRLLLAIAVDVHHGVATNIDGEEFFDRAVPSAVGCGLSMSPGDHLWFTVSRYYTQAAHGKNSLRDFAYLAAAISDPQCDWDLIMDADTRFDLGAALFYYLAFLDKLVAGAVPNEVLERTDPRKTSRGIDWGWQLSRLFEQPEPYPL
jgi:Uncharacterised nucleotidyltransferase